MGIAVGGIGMNYDDFCRMTPAAFDKVLKYHVTRRESDHHDAWERTRALAYILIQPYLGKGSTLTAQALMPMPWDRDESVKTRNITPEQQRERMKDLAARLGDDLII